MKKIHFFFILIALLCACKNSKRIDNSYKDSSKSISERVEILINQMTIEEKVAQLFGVYVGKTQSGINASFTTEQLNEMMPLGIGQLCQPGKRRSDTEIVDFITQVQTFLIHNTRLGIPALCHEEGLHGMIANGVSSFPTPIAMSCSWNDSLVNKVYDKIGRELRSVGMTLTLSPVLDVAIDSRWGRFEETFGEDPELVSRMGVAAVSGFQGGGEQIDSNHVIATGKHFCAYAAGQNGNNVAPAMVTEDDLWNIHLRPFKNAIKKSHLLAIMPSYNEVNGIPSHANNYLLTEVLRDKLDFKGIIVSDYGGVKELRSIHSIAENDTMAAKLAFNAGVDFDLPNNTCYNYLVDLVKKKEIDIKELDKRVRNVLRLKFELGLFDHPYPNKIKAKEIVGNQQGVDLVYNIAKESIVLLENKNSILPLEMEKYKSIAIIGPNAKECLLGSYYGTPKYCVSAYDGIVSKFGIKNNIKYAKGCNITIEKIDSVKKIKLNPEDPDKYDIKKTITLTNADDDNQLIQEAVNVASSSSIIILCVGGNLNTTRESFFDNPMGDRDDLTLSPAQRALFLELKKLGKPIITLLIHGGVLSDEIIFKNSDALVDCHYLGQETGNAIASVLAGEINPSGKLSYSIPRNAGQIPVYYYYKPSAKRGYGFTKTEPLYPFGYGLSYTHFEIKNLKSDKKEYRFLETIKVQVELENNGKKDGSEVVQLYIRDVFSSITRPIKELKDYKKVFLKPGNKTKITFLLTTEQLGFYNTDKKYITESGDFILMVGNSSSNLISDTIRIIK